MSKIEDMFACPRCGSLEKFGNRRRVISDELHEVYVKCTTCRYELLVISDHPSKIHNQKEITKLKQRVLRDPSLRFILKRKIQRMKDEPVD